MAFRLQTSAPELMNLKSESKETLDLYGCDPDKPSFARACLLARRMIERGVRFVNIYHEGWDAHSDVVGNLKNNCGATDQASAALIKDLKQRGLLDETLVIWGGEFGRTPMVENNAALGRRLGRDHHPQAFTMWLAGGGIKPGLTYGATDELGFHVVENEVHIHDLQATLLHCLGFDHERLTYFHQGRNFRLTDVSGRVVKEILGLIDGSTAKTKRKPNSPRRLRMNRPVRLQSARTWLAPQNGRTPARIGASYRRRYGVDWPCTILELTAKLEGDEPPPENEPF